MNGEGSIFDFDNEIIVYGTIKKWWGRVPTVSYAYTRACSLNRPSRSGNWSATKRTQTLQLFMQSGNWEIRFKEQSLRMDKAGTNHQVHIYNAMFTDTTRAKEPF